MPSTKCLSVTRISSWRPGRAEASSTIAGLPPSMAMSCSIRSSLEAETVVARRTRAGARRGERAEGAEVLDARRMEDARGATTAETLEAAANMARAGVANPSDVDVETPGTTSSGQDHRSETGEQN